MGQAEKALRGEWEQREGGEVAFEEEGELSQSLGGGAERWREGEPGKR